MKNYFKYILTIVMATTLTITASAQVDRSKMPTPGKTPTINLGTPATYKLPNGMTLLIVENHKLPRVTVSLMMDVPPYTEGSKVGISNLTSALMGNGSTSIPKDKFNEEVDFLAGNVSLSATGGYASSLSKYFPRILELMADAALHPNFTQEELDKEKAKLIEGIKSGENSAASVAGIVRNALVYGKNHPYGEFPTEESISSISLDDVKSFYKDHFSPHDAYMVVSGDVNAEEVKSLVFDYFNGWIPATAIKKSVPTPMDVQYAQINFVDMPNAVQSEIRANNLVDLTMADEDYFPVLIANYILGGGFGSYINMNLREKHGFTYGARSGVDSDKWTKGNFGVSTKVRNAVTDSAVVEIMKEIKRIREEDVSDENIETAKSKYLGDFIMATENPQTIARYAINIKTNKLPDDFYKNYIAKINAVTKADIKRVANTYFRPDNLRFVIVGKGVEVADKLEALKHNGKSVPVFYFDKEGDKVDKPNFDKPVPQGVTAKTVLQGYVNAVADAKTLENIKTVMINAKGEVQGMALDLEIKQSGTDKYALSIGMGGNVMSKQVYNNGTGYVMAQGQKVTLDTNQLATLKGEAGVLPERNLLNSTDVRLVGIEAVNGVDAYVVQLSENKKGYYSVADGLKIQEIAVQEMGGQTFQTTVGYSDYRDVKGAKFPFLISQSMMGQAIDFKVDSIKLNEGVTDADFQ